MPENTHIDGAIESSIQHRCPDMGTHQPFGPVPVPCDRCYSLHVTSEVIRYQPSIPRQVTTPPGEATP